MLLVIIAILKLNFDSTGLTRFPFEFVTILRRKIGVLKLNL